MNPQISPVQRNSIRYIYRVSRIYPPRAVMRFASMEDVIADIVKIFKRHDKPILHRMVIEDGVQRVLNGEHEHYHFWGYKYQDEHGGFYEPIYISTCRPKPLYRNGDIIPILRTLAHLIHQKKAVARFDHIEDLVDDIIDTKKQLGDAIPDRKCIEREVISVLEGKTGSYDNWVYIYENKLTEDCNNIEPFTLYRGPLDKNVSYVQDLEFAETNKNQGIPDKEIVVANQGGTAPQKERVICRTPLNNPFSIKKQFRTWNDIIVDINNSRKLRKKPELTPCEIEEGIKNVLEGRTVVYLGYAYGYKDELNSKYNKVVTASRLRDVKRPKLIRHKKQNGNNKN